MIGLTRAEGKQVPTAVQRHLVRAQVEDHCRRRQRLPALGCAAPLKQALNGTSAMPSISGDGSSVRTGGITRIQANLLVNRTAISLKGSRISEQHFGAGLCGFRRGDLPHVQGARQNMNRVICRRIPISSSHSIGDRRDGSCSQHSTASWVLDPDM